MSQHPGKQHGSHLSRDPREGQRRRVTQEEALRHLQEAAEGGDELAKRMLFEFQNRGRPTLGGTGNIPLSQLQGVVQTPDGRFILAATGEEVGGDSGAIGNLAGPALGKAVFNMSKLPTLARMLQAPKRFLSRFTKLSPAKQRETLTKLTKDTEKFRTGVRTTRATPKQVQDLNVADDVLDEANKFVSRGRVGQSISRGAAAVGTGLAAGRGAVATVASKGASLGRTLGRNKLRTVGFLLGANYLGEKVEDVTGVDIPGIKDLFDTGPSPQEVNVQAAQVQAAKEGARQVRGEGFITRAGQIRDQLVGDIVGRSQRGLEATKVDLESQALSKVQGRLNKVIEATGGRVTGEQALRAINTLQSPRMVQHFSLDEPNLKTQMDLEASIVEIMASPEFRQAGNPQNDLQEAESGPQ